MNESARMMLVLVGVCIASALLLSMVYGQTQPRIIENREKALEEAIYMAQPKAKQVDALGVQEGLIQEAYELSDDSGSQVGYAVLIEFNGFQGAIRTVYGLDNDFKITGVRVLEHTETPGLGSKIAGDEFLNQFKGDTPGDVSVDAITGATISSKALIDAVKESLGEAREVLT